MISFHVGLIGEAAFLLAGQRRREQVTFPELPAHFEDPHEAQAAVTAALQKQGARGMASVLDAHRLGYLIIDLAPIII